MIIKAIKSTLTLWPNEGQIKPFTRSQKKQSTNIQLATHINNKNIQINTSKHLFWGFGP